MILRHHDLAPFPRQPAFVQDLHKFPARERRGCGGFHDDRTSRSDRCCGLMHDQVQWMVERTEGEHHTDRLLLREGKPSDFFVGLGHGNHLTGLVANRLVAELDAVYGAVHLDARVDERLAALGSRSLDELVVAVAHHRHGSLEHLATKLRGQLAAPVAKKLERDRERTLGIRLVGGRNSCQ